MAKRQPATIFYEDADVIVIRNLLRWVPVMLLAIPKAHITQEDLWSGPTIALVAAAAAQVGKEQCPGGFRLLSNFGRDAMQTQEHGHIHILGGMHLGPYG